MAPYNKPAQAHKAFGFRPEFDELEHILEQERYPEVDKTSENWKPTIERLRRKCSSLNNERLVYYGRLQMESERNRDLENMLQAHITEHEKVVSALAAKVDLQSTNGNLDTELDLKKKLEERINGLENELAEIKAAREQRSEPKYESEKYQLKNPAKNESNDIERVLRSISDLKDQLEERIDKLSLRQQILDQPQSTQPAHSIPPEFLYSSQSASHHHSQPIYQQPRTTPTDKPNARSAFHSHAQPVYNSPRPTRSEFPYQSHPTISPQVQSVDRFPQTAESAHNQDLPQFQRPHAQQPQAQRPSVQSQDKHDYQYSRPDEPEIQTQTTPTQPDIQAQIQPDVPPHAQPPNHPENQPQAHSESQSSQPTKSDDPLISILLQEIIASNQGLHTQISQLSQTQNAHYNELSERIRHQSEETHRQNARHDLRFAKLEEIIADRFTHYDTKVKQQQPQFNDTPQFSNSIATPPSSRGHNPVVSPKPMQHSSLNDSRSSDDYTTTGSSHSTLSTSTPNHNNSRPQEVGVSNTAPSEDPYSARIRALYDRLRNGELNDSEINRYESIYDKSDQILRERPQLMTGTKNLVNDLQDHLPKKHLPLLTAVREDLV